MGRTALVGEAILIEHTPANSYSFAGISFASASGNSAEFYIVSSQSQFSYNALKISIRLPFYKVSKN